MKELAHWEIIDSKLGPLEGTVRRAAVRRFGKGSPLLKPILGWYQTLRNRLKQDLLQWDEQETEILAELSRQISDKIARLPADATEDQMISCLISPDTICQELSMREVPDQDGFVSYRPPGASSAPHPILSDPPAYSNGLLWVTGSGRGQYHHSRRSARPGPPTTASPPTFPPAGRQPPRPRSSHSTRSTHSTHPHCDSASTPAAPLAELDSDGEPILVDPYGSSEQHSLSKASLSVSVTDRAARRYGFQGAGHWRTVKGW